MNIYAHNYDLEGVKKYLHEIKDYGFDAVLVSDPGIFTLVKEIIPEIDIHISTQANNTNYLTFKFWHDLGATRIVCARELSLAEIKETRANIPDDLEIEAFMHGAMCISYSGRCLLSSYFTGRDANKGDVRIRADGSMRLLKKKDRASICRLRKMKEGHIYSIPRICAWRITYLR